MGILSSAGLFNIAILFPERLATGNNECYVTIALDVRGRWGVGTKKLGGLMGCISSKLINIQNTVRKSLTTAHHIEQSSGSSFCDIHKKGQLSPPHRLKVDYR